MTMFLAVGTGGLIERETIMLERQGNLFGKVLKELYRFSTEVVPQIGGIDAAVSKMARE
jgi:hypothetical protein